MNEFEVSEFEDKRSYIKILYHFFIAFIHSLCKSFWYKKYNDFQMFRTIITNTRLVVLVHGLNSSPSRWTSYIEFISKKYPSVNFILYRVPRYGNCGLKEASDPLIIRINEYLSVIPTTDIILIGTSNGARICARVERKLYLCRQTIHTISISGIHKGTKCIVFKWFFHPKIVRDFEYNSQRSLLLLKKWKQSLSLARGKRIHTFFVSSSDERVYPYTSGLVKLSESDTYVVYDGYTHSSLANGIMNEVMSILS